jgi:Flp pilus assembly pilin Flp
MMTATRLQEKLRRLRSDETGQTSLEYVLILVVFGIPMVAVVRWLLETLVEHYRMITFMETLPLP